MKFQLMEDHQNDHEKLEQGTTAEDMLIEQSSIRMTETFRQLYLDFEDDLKAVRGLEKIQSVPDRQSVMAEKLIFHRINKGILGKDVTIRKSSPYDDKFKHVDFVCDLETSSEPMVMTIDVTLAQGNIERQDNDFNGIDKKLGRIREHIEYLSDIDPQTARDFKAWLNSGGLKEIKTEENEMFYKIADKVIELKYYRNIKNDSDTSNVVRPVISGPQTVVSFDSNILNKVESGSIREEMFDDIVRVEIISMLQIISTYLSKLINEKKVRNSLFDEYYSAVNGWKKSLEDKDHGKIFENAISRISNNPSYKTTVLPQINFFINKLQEYFK